MGRVREAKWQCGGATGTRLVGVLQDLDVVRDVDDAGQDEEDVRPAGVQQMQHRGGGMSRMFERGDTFHATSSSFLPRHRGHPASGRGRLSGGMPVSHTLSPPLTHQTSGSSSVRPRPTVRGYVAHLQPFDDERAAGQKVSKARAQYSRAPIAERQTHQVMSQPMAAAISTQAATVSTTCTMRVVDE